ncbi:MAG: hypothetical protein ACFCUW_11160 [Kiloniellaceae bacterium]
MSESIGRTLLQQRIRNRLMDVLEIASAFDEIARCGTSETINLWEDWYRESDSDFYAEPVFSVSERKQIIEFSKVWNETAEVEEDNTFDPEKLKTLPHWCRFRDAAETALRVFEQRGRCSEDKEQFQA